MGDSLSCLDKNSSLHLAGRFLPCVILPGLCSHIKPLDPYSGRHVAPSLQGLYSHGLCEKCQNDFYYNLVGYGYLLQLREDFT